MEHKINEKGYYGQFGGAYIPEMLYPNVKELKDNYLKIMNEPSFKQEFNDLLRDYVGRPTPLYFRFAAYQKSTTLIFILKEKICVIQERIK